MSKNFLTGHWGALGASIVLASVTTALGLAVPWLTKLMVDRALVGQRPDLILPLAGAVAGIGLLKFVAGLARRLVSGRMSLAVEYDLRNRIFSHLQSMGQEFYSDWPSGQLISRSIQDVRIVRMFLSYGLIFIITHVLTLLAVTGILFTMQPRLALAALVPMPLLLVLARRFSSRLHPSLWAIQERVAELTAAAEEKVVGIRIIKALAVETRHQEEFAEASDRIYTQSLEAAYIRSRYIPVLGFLPSLSLLIILFYGGRMVMAGDLSLGELVAFNGYIMLLVWPLRMLGMLVSWTERARASGNRILEILDQDRGLKTSADSDQVEHLSGEVEFKNVGFSYGEWPVLHDISLHIKPKETLALVGPTGCGKSTTALLIPRFYDPSSGQVLLDGQDIRTYDLGSLRRRIGLVDQDPFLFSVTVRENISYGKPDATPDEIQTAARAASAEDFILKLPEQYETRVGERGVDLSGGQRQRLALARALLIDPDILILDDATSSVDAETESHILAAIAGVRGTRTVIIIAHRPSTIALADRVAVLRNGRLVDVGRPSEIGWHTTVAAEGED